MSRIEHEDWACEHCSGRGWCSECSGIGTREAYYQTQELHAAAIKDENGLAAQTLEQISFLPELVNRTFWVSKLIQFALREARAA